MPNVRSPRGKTRRAAAVVAAGLLALVFALASPLALLHAETDADAAGSGAYDFGAWVAYRGCLRLSAFNYRDRQESVDNHDWLRLRVENGCPGVIRNLHVRLDLYDGEASAYGSPVWLLGRGEALGPGQFWEDDLAIADPDRRSARRWGFLILRADGVPGAAGAKKAPAPRGK